jgi:opacity protein-like surface antigen
MAITLRTFIVAVVVGSWCSATAQAQTPAPADGPYVAGSLDISHRQPAEDAAARNTFDTGWKANGGLGYRFGAIRVEGEYTRFRNAFKEITLFFDGGALPAEASEGSAHGHSLFASIHYDVATGGALRPYAGVGLGTYKVHIDGLTSPTLGSFGITVDETTGWTRAFQVRGGLAVAIAPGAEVLVGYRWHRGFPLTFTVPGVGELNPGGVRTHSGEIGFRYTFGS